MLVGPSPRRAANKERGDPRVDQDRDAVYRAKSSEVRTGVATVAPGVAADERTDGRDGEKHTFAESDGPFRRTDSYDLVCLSHLRWDFVHQRPQHLLSRCARSRRVFFVEEPIFDGGPARLDVTPRMDGLQVVVPHLPAGLADAAVADEQRRLLDGLFGAHHIRRYALWYYTPMALAFSRHLDPAVTVYDCMDELSAFAFAPPALREHEAELL